MSRVVLVVIYNHRFDRNIDRIEALYGPRFDRIFHLVPFYDGHRPNVIPVYENSYYFQGYVAQGHRSFKTEGVDHYLFVGDDLILNPAIDSTNYATEFKLTKESAFLPGWIPLHRTTWWWSRKIEAYRYSQKVRGVEVKGMLPEREEALRAFTRHGLDQGPLSIEQLWQRPKGLRAWRDRFREDHTYIKEFVKNLFRRKEYHLPYPLVGSYSDIFIVPAETLDRFCQYCGIFAATRLFVEIALPTAMVLTAKRIVTEQDLDRKGKALWGKAARAELDVYKSDLGSLLAGMTKETLYLHPVKLSQWN